MATSERGDSNNSITRLVGAIAGIATQQRPPAITMLKPITMGTLILDCKNEKLELFEHLFRTMPKMQLERTEATKNNPFLALLRNEALQAFTNNNASNRKTLDDVLIVFR